MEREGFPLPAPVFSAHLPFLRPFPFKGKARHGDGVQIDGGEWLQLRRFCRLSKINRVSFHMWPTNLILFNE